MSSIKKSEYLEEAVKIARDAGELIMGYFTDGYELSHKGDKSPVTNADIAANRFITDALKRLDGAIPIIAEEDEVLGPSASCFWLVDPLDGTRAFVAGEPEFSVNIGLIENGLPVLGVLGVPAQQRIYYGAEGMGAYRIIGHGAAEKIQVREKPKDGLTVVRSKSHPSTRAEAFLKTLHIKETLPSSSAIKFCQVAEGAADIYPRFGRTMEWDTAAGHAILNAAGGRVTMADGAPLIYGKPHFENPHFIAYGYSK